MAPIRREMGKIPGNRRAFYKKTEEIPQDKGIKNSSKSIAAIQELFKRNRFTFFGVIFRCHKFSFWGFWKTGSGSLVQKSGFLVGGAKGCTFHPGSRNFGVLERTFILAMRGQLVISPRQEDTKN